MSDNTLNRSTYLNKNEGNYEESITINGQEYSKVDDLRYGTNPHQTAAFYKPNGKNCPIGDLQILKNGKNGLSQTNLEDISFALNICKFFEQPGCAVMKHVNPSGAAIGDNAIEAFEKAWNSDPRAAFGSTIAFNLKIEADTADAIMQNFVECVVAPEVSDEALAVFHDFEKYKKNRHIRILKCGDLSQLPRYIGEDTSQHLTYKSLIDGSVVLAQPLMTALTAISDLKPATAVHKEHGEIKSEIAPSDSQLVDLITSWYININVRSNGVVIVKNGGTLSVGTGEQDRVGAIEQAIAKFKLKYEGDEELDGSVMASDGFFPFYDGVETAAEAGVSAIIAPAGSIKDYEVIKRANELGVAMIHAPERVFSHH